MSLHHLSSYDQIESDYGFLGEVKMQHTRSGSRGSITSMPDK